MKNKIIYICIVIILLGGLFYVEFQRKESKLMEQQKNEVTAKEKYIPDPNAPKFEDYPAGEKFNEIPVAPDFKTNPEAKKYYTKITEGSKKGPDFAGEYVVSIYGCGFGCQYNTIVNIRTGRIVAYNIESNRGSEYKMGSRLFVINPPAELYESYGNDIPSYVSTQYYYLSENGLDLIKLDYDTKKNAGENQIEKQENSEISKSDPEIVTYKFEDYTTTKNFIGTPALPDFRTNPKAKLYYTMITDGAKAEANFAGEYNVIGYGCGSACQLHTIINSRTGRIVAYNILSTSGVEYRLDSRLFIVNPVSDLPRDESYSPVEYYYLSDDGSELIKLANYTAGEKQMEKQENSEVSKDTLYWSNAIVDADGTTYFVRRNMGKAGCEINSTSREIPDFCKSGPETDSDLSQCGSERNPSMATTCELVAWRADGTQDFIVDLLKIAPSQYNDLAVDLLGFSESGTVLIRYGNPWPHESWYGIFTYDISDRLRSEKPLVVWSGGYYNEWSVLEKDDYKLIFHPWIYDRTSVREEGINDIGIYLVDHGKTTKVNFSNYSFSQTSPNVEMIVANNWKPSSSISFCVGKEKWSFNFETKSFLNLNKKDQFCESLN